MADAIHVVADPPLASATFAWTPTLGSTGDYEVFAKWMAASDREPDSVYTVTHTTGTADVTVNQQANGGAWVSLGTFTLDPASAKVVLSGGGGTGSLSADAVSFVAAGAPPANVYYVHSDNLGTPRLMTDSLAVVVWDRQSYPFGATYSTAGLGDSNVRFPGQYFDAESGLHYNYFRDYDPATGRYIQSDPIGLRGGLNTYGYVGGNPINRIDPLGLQEIGMATCTLGPNPVCIGFSFATACKWLFIGVSAGLAIYTASDSCDGDSCGGDTPTVVGKPPFKGPPGGRINADKSDGAPKQDREYGPDGYPDKDADYDHDHGQGQPHVHDWGRPGGGNPPTNDDRGPGRPPKPGEVR